MTGNRVESNAQRLFERDRELAEIDTCIADAAAERGSFLVLEGRSGMGKSSLLAEVGRRAARAGLAVCSATGSELEGDFAFGVVRQLLEPAVVAMKKEDRAHLFEGAAALAAPVLDMGGRPGAGGKFATMHGLYWLAANLSAGTPLLLAVDDAHWADAASLGWLAYVLNRLEGLPILVTIATRPPQHDPQGEVLTAILASPRVRILSIGPLGERSVTALVRATLDADPDPIFTAACIRATAGNPLGLSELLRELRAGGVAPTSGAARDLERRAPDAIARRVLRDLSLLGQEAQRLAAALAVIGDGTELRLIASLADVGVDEAAEVADALQSADLIAPERPPRFAHPLLRAAVYDTLPAGVRQRLHRRAAAIVGSAGGEPEAVAAHLLRCEAGGSPEIIEWLRAAAPLAQRRGAPEAAISYLRRALAEEAEPGTRSSVLAELGAAEVAVGDPAAVPHLREALARTTDPRSRSAILIHLATGAMAQSDERTCRNLLSDAIEELKVCDQDRSTRLECLVMPIYAGDLPGGPAMDSALARLRKLALDATPNGEVARVTLAWLLSWRDGNRDETMSLVGSDFGQSLLFHGRDLDAFGVLWSIAALLGADELHRAAGWCETVIREAVSHGHYPILVVEGLLFRAYAEARLGLLAEAESDASAALELSRQHFPYWGPQSGAYLAEILFERGRQKEAYDAIEGVSVGPAVRMTVEAKVREVRGRLRCARGWQQRGVDDLRASGRLCELHGLRNPIVWTWRVSLGPALAEDGIDEARQLAQENLANARRSGIPRAIGVALHTLARVDSHASVDVLQGAVEALKDVPAPLDLAGHWPTLGGHLGTRAIGSRPGSRSAKRSRSRPAAVPCVSWNTSRQKRWRPGPALDVLASGGWTRSRRVSCASLGWPPKAAPIARSRKRSSSRRRRWQTICTAATASSTSRPVTSSPLPWDCQIPRR